MYQYVIGGSQSRWSLTDDTDLPELFREIEEVDKELSDAKAPSQDEEKAKMKWIMSSEECSVSCGGGKYKKFSSFIHHLVPAPELSSHFYNLLSSFACTNIKPNFHMSEKSQIIGEITFPDTSQILLRYRKIARRR